MASIADILIAKGNAEANAVSQRGNIYADLIRNLSSLPGQVIQQQRATEQQNMERQRLQQQISSAQSEQALQAQQGQLNTLKIADAQQQAQGQQALTQSLQQHTTTDPETGHLAIDADAVYNDVAKVHPGVASAFLDDHSKRMDLIAQGQQHALANTKVAAQLQADLASSVADAKPEDRPARYASLMAQLKTTYAGAPAIASAFKPLPPVYDPSVDTVLSQIAEQGTSKADKIEQALKASTTTKNLAEAGKATAEGEKAHAEALAGPKPTGPELDAAQQKLLVKKFLGQPLTPEEQAQMKAYDERKTVVTDAASLAASNRLASTQQQQNQLQQNAQNFKQTETARDHIVKEVNEPFVKARSAANELRAIVTAAQGGNKVAAAEQPLATAGALVKSLGLNRINTAEIGVPASAGSAVDRFVGWVGGFTNGQKIAPDIQNDMLQVADMLEKKAKKDAADAHAGINKVYGTNIPPSYDYSTAPDAKVITPPVSSGAPAVDTVRSANGETRRWTGSEWVLVK